MFSGSFSIESVSGSVYSESVFLLTMLGMRSSWTLLSLAHVQTSGWLVGVLYQSLHVAFFDFCFVMVVLMWKISPNHVPFLTLYAGIFLISILFNLRQWLSESFSTFMLPEVLGLEGEVSCPRHNTVFVGEL